MINLFSVCTGHLVCSSSGTLPQDRPHFTLWQIPSQVKSIGMNYVLQTNTGKVVVFDGGWEEDAPYTRGFLAALGNCVDTWIITHPHQDHAGVLKPILEEPDGIIVEKIFQSSLDPELYFQQDRASGEFADAFYATVKASGVESVEVEPGMEMVLDGVRFEVLGAKNPELTENYFNDQSLVVKVSDASKSVLFLGDLGWDGGRKLLASEYGSRVGADYVQMAHHGQRGVDEDFYKAVNPKYCLWPTPQWVWDNITEKGVNTGILKTMETREWMSKLPIEKHYLSFEGLVRID